LKRRPVSLLVVLVLAAAVGCDFERPHESVDAWRLESLPADGAVAVAHGQRVVIRLDRRLLPRSVSPASVRISSGAVSVATRVRLQPVWGELWIDLERPLDPEVTYRLEVEGLVDLDGHVLAEAYSARFRTGLDAGAEVEQPELAPGAVLALLRTRCATVGCHAGPAPALGLNLEDHAAITKTAIGAASRFAQGNVHDESVRGAFTLAGLRIIDIVAGRGQAATSLLIYKLLGDEHVPGAPMPPDAVPLNRQEAELVSTWIEAGAPAR
jgi:Bacterial Ig-like domain